MHLHCPENHYFRNFIDLAYEFNNPYLVPSLQETPNKVIHGMQFQCSWGCRMNGSCAVTMHVTLFPLHISSTNSKCSPKYFVQLIYAHHFATSFAEVTESVVAKRVT
ncbi:hypothetical protein Mgra_00008527 [Meloidogyne graminicola]|uniref:Uncharacterized protein n=1 Tax=Meloidogyne graminicola TaxID=189291 RepID=A0A8S9ZFI7_9BILA|nr:hypothetical protein Mgra_00008527 [Meloidogyne graminicola]